MPDETTAPLDGLAGSTPPWHPLSGMSGTIRFRPHLSPLRLRPGKCRQDYRQSSRPVSGRCVGCSNHPVFPKGVRSSENTVPPPLLPAELKERNARRMPAGLHGKSSPPIFGGKVGCSIHPGYREVTRSSDNCPAKTRRRGDEKILGECRRRLQGPHRAMTMECVR
jgi:hypothetical protein